MHSLPNTVNQVQPARNRIALSLLAVFIASFVSLLFAQARTIAQPAMISEFDGMALFSWLIALPALAGASATLLFGKLSDIYGRRTMILLCIAIFAVGLGVAATSKSMMFLVIAITLMTIGHWPIFPLCFAVIGDLFPPSQRAKWTGLLNIPTGFAALFGPVIGGAVAESVLGWRGLFWGSIPLILITAGLVAVAVPNAAQKVKPKIDVAGTLVMVAAMTSLLLGFSWLRSPETIVLGALLLLLSLAVWILFIQVEKRADAPILDLRVLFNRTFLTAAVAGLLANFAPVAITGYSTIFVQEVMAISPTISGTMLTPYSAIVAFMGVPIGFLLARTPKYRNLYMVGYAVLALSLLAMWRFTASTPIAVFVLVTSVAAVGFGMIPTINAVVAQFAVPKDLLGVATGAVFFFQMVGLSISPAILGLAQSSSPSFEGGLRLVFLAGAVVVGAALLLILTIPEIPLDIQPEESNEPSKKAFSTEPSS